MVLRLPPEFFQVLGGARQSGIRVIFTRHMSLPKELMGVSQLRMAMAWQRVKSVDEVKPWFLRDSPGFHLIPELNPLPSEAVFDKITMSAFEGTPLNIALRDCGIEAFAVVGIAMEVGIEPTVRHGADLGYIPVVVKDACGFGNRDAAERSTASLEFAGDVLVTNVEAICAPDQHAAAEVNAWWAGHGRICGKANGAGISYWRSAAFSSTKFEVRLLVVTTTVPVRTSAPMNLSRRVSTALTGSKSFAIRIAAPTGGC